MTELDPETKAIGSMAAVLADLDDEQRSRVVRHIAERFAIAIHTASRKPGAGPETSKSGSQSEAKAEFPDFASLYDACSPSTDAYRALVAGYWIQVIPGAAGFDSQSVNKELKHLGHGVGNITAALTKLKNQKPSLVLQVKKSGNTQQARKLYKLTEQGVRKIQALISGNEDPE